jgi:transposase InsO family protein
VAARKGPPTSEPCSAAGGYPRHPGGSPVNFSTTSPTSRTSWPTGMAAGSTIPLLPQPAPLLRNHAPEIAAMDFFVVPTIGFGLLYAFVIVRIDRRDLARINVTANPTAEWVARQITEAFPWDEAPHYLIRDRDRIYGSVVKRRLRAMGIRDKPTAPASPWQNGFAERLIGSIRRECLDHIIVFGEAHLRRTLKCYADYYNNFRTHRSLNKDAPVCRPVQRIGSIKSHAILGGLHYKYVRA